MNTRNLALKRIYDYITCISKDSHDAYFVKGQMDMALHLNLIDKDLYIELCKKFLSRMGLQVAFWGEIYEHDDVYWDCYIVINDNGYYHIVVDTNDANEMSLDADTFYINLSGGWTLLCEKHLQNYEIYDINGKYVDLAGWNGTYNVEKDKENFWIETPSKPEGVFIISNREEDC